MKVPVKPVSQAINRPDGILEAVAADAWQAYNAMESTKRRHYEFLELLDNKKKNYNMDPSGSEQTRLAALLKDHDQQVSRFTMASSALKLADREAHMALFVYIGAISDNPGDTPSRH